MYRSVKRKLRAWLKPGPAPRTDGLVSVDARGRPLLLRDGSEADRAVHYQMFSAKEYDLGRLRRGVQLTEFVRRIAPRKPLIIDCGANIGASSVWFCGDFPTARVVAIEPDQANIDLLRRNCAGLDVVPVHGAISCQHEILELTDPGLGEWGYRTQVPVAENLSRPRVDAYSIDHLIREHADCVPFIVKIDIEGGEARLFERNTDWIDEIPLIIIELHDKIMPESANSGSFLRALATRRRDFLYRAENVFSLRNPI